MSEKVSGLNLSLLSFWPVLLLVGFASATFLPAVVVGYRWTVEFSLAGFLLLAILWEMYRGGHQSWFGFSHKEKLLVLYPLILFTIWSFVSILWADSYRNVLH